MSDLETLDDRARSSRGRRELSSPALTVLHHPDMRRVGQRVLVEPLVTRGARVGVGRAEPLFADPGDDGGPAKALATPYISRKPVWLIGDGKGGVTLDPTETRTAVYLGGDDRELNQARSFSAAEVVAGVVFMVSSDVVLLLHNVLLRGEPPPAIDGLIGHSDGIERVRAQIAAIAASTAPVLVRGETGSGKELVARAIHDRSARAARPYVAVNLGAVPSTLAASELFGHTRGAFSGAQAERAGYFERADRGTLFLDEVGEAPTDVQAMMLRALENGEVQRVGASRVKSVDVRLVSATDADLEARVDSGTFRAPLLYRLTSHVIEVPPLRQRRDDVGRLLVHFLTEELGALGRSDRLVVADPRDPPWLPGAVVARLVDYAWPGNVRQLRNVARYLASVDTPTVDDPHLERLLAMAPATNRQQAPAGKAAPAVSAGPKRAPADIAEAELAQTLASLDYRLGPTAAALGISRPSLNRLIDRFASVTRAQSLDAATIRATRDACGGDLERMWRRLKVSKRSLKLRIQELGLADGP